MLKRILCEAQITWKLECPGPLLIADGRYDKKNAEPASNKNSNSKKEVVSPDKFFINKISEEEMHKRVTNANGKPPDENDWKFYVPGTSLRGPFRAHAEKIIRSLLPETKHAGLTACDPFARDENSPAGNIGCTTRINKLNGAKTKYALACPACKIFGCGGLIGRITFEDAPIETYQSRYRDMIGIDRFTGGVHQQPKENGKGARGANMRFHVLEDSEFSTTVTLVNFEIWHLGLLAYVFRDFMHQRVPVGFGKTKGFGRVTGKIEKILLSYPFTPERIEHMGSLMTDSDSEEREKYQIEIFDAPEFGDKDFKKVNDDQCRWPMFNSFEVADPQAFMGKTAPFFNQFIENTRKKIMESEKAITDEDRAENKEDNI